MSIIIRFCSEARLDPDALLGKLTSADVKSWFDWIERNFEGSIKAHSALSCYWRTLKRLYFLKNHKDMEVSMQKDCLNVSNTFFSSNLRTLSKAEQQYMNLISRRMGLRRHPLPRPTAASDDLLQFLVTHLVHCNSVFADEKQRVYPLAGLNLSSISACRAVSLFDTRHPVKLQPDGSQLNPSEKDPTNDKGSVSPRGSFNEEALIDSDYEMDIGGHVSELDKTIPNDGSCDESDTDMERDTDYQSDCSSVTDDGYLAGDEETGTILWRHVEFCIVRNPVPEGRNILAAIVTLLHTKGEDRKPRM